MSGQSRLAGRVVKAHGLGGEVVVDVRTDAPERRFAPGAVLGARHRDGTAGILTVQGSRPHGGRLLLAFEGVTGRDQAEALRGTLLTVAPPDEQPADPDEFHDSQLEGLAVELTDGSAVGTVADVVHGPGGELLAVRRPGGAVVLVPFVREIVPTVDVGAGRIVLTPPEGLLD